MRFIPRPRKNRNIGFNPKFKNFAPDNCPDGCEKVTLLIEEIESIRLMDYENLDQSACAEKMDIGRSTFQRIYKNARLKIADSLINGKPLIIEESYIGKGHCHRRGQDKARGHRNPEL